MSFTWSKLKPTAVQFQSPVISNPGRNQTASDQLTPGCAVSSLFPESPEQRDLPSSVPDSASANPYSSPVIAEITPITYDSEWMAPMAPYRFARLGFQMIFWSHLGILGSLLLGIVGFFLLRAVAPGAAIFSGVAVMICVVTGALVSFAGYCMCLGAPHSNEKKMIIISVILIVVSVLMSIGGGVAGAVENWAAIASTIAVCLQFISQICGFASIVFFCQYCKRIGQNNSNPVLIRAAGSSRVWWIVLLVFLIILNASLSASHFLRFDKAEWYMYFVLAEVVVVLAISIFAFTKMMLMLWTAIKATTIPLRHGPTRSF